MKIGVLVAQLGTPEEPTAKGLRPYLNQFLSDRRVIDYSPLIWQPILHGIILRTRPSKSAKLYSRIWTDEGSPLLVYSQAQVEQLQTQLGEDYHVILGMTYGNPSIASAIETLENQQIDRIIILPMFPQYSSTTTSSIYDAVYRAAAGISHHFSNDHKRFTPTLRFIAPYYKNSSYIDAMKKHLEEEVSRLTYTPDKFIITFHGIPNRYIKTGDPYRKHCEETASLLADAMGWIADDWILCFQSRFGPEAWLEPYTEDVLTELHNNGVQRPLIFSPGFVTDCLETLDELGNEGLEQFAEGGGNPDYYSLAPCLNLNTDFIDTITQIVKENAHGWL